MLISYKHDQDSVILRVKILDSSATTGAGKTGLTSVSSGLIISTIADNEATATAYTVAGSLVETIATLGTYAAPTATKCRFKEVDATNHPGVYEIQLADARFAVSSAKSLLVSISGATDAAECDALIPLTQVDPYSSFQGTDGKVLVSTDSQDLSSSMDVNAKAIGNDAIGSSQLAASASTELRTAINGGDYALDTDANGRIRIVDGTGAGELDTDTGTVALRAATQTSIDSIEADTNELQSDDVPGLIAGLNNLSTSDIDTRLSAIGLDHLVSASVTGADVADNSIIAKLVSASATADWDDFVNTTDSLQALRDWIGDGTNLTESGGTGDHLTSLATASSISALNNLSQAEITGGAYALDTDANGRVRIVDGTSAGELDTSSGLLAGIAGTKNTFDDLNDLSAANVNSEVLDVLSTDTLPELAQSQPPTNPTHREAIMLLYMALRNKVTQTASEFGIHNNAGTKIASKTTSDDGTTYTETTMASGA